MNPQENDVLHPEFLRRMQAMLSPNDYAAYLCALSEPPRRLARKNPLKSVPDALLAAELGGYPFLPPEAKPGRGALHAAGAYYVQEPAAAAVAALLPPLLPPDARVLDMCAAPGGKVSAVAAARPDCLFLANEIVFSRAKILLSNVERLGLRNVTVTSLHPDEIAARGESLFDAIIADVPCSGEGMLRKAAFRSDDLRDESVTACADRARKILTDCHACLRTGGILLFSTCTFNTAENEDQVRRLYSIGYEPIAVPRPPHAREGFGLPQAVRFFPQDGGGEGHFACVLRKTAQARTAPSARPSTRGKAADTQKRMRQLDELIESVTAERFLQAQRQTAGEGCEFLPPAYPFAAFPALRRGVRLCDFVGDRIVPHHHFATAAASELLRHAPDYPPEAAEIAAYLSGQAFACNEKSGFRAVKVASLPLGWVKISDGIAKSHYPKGLRV